MRRCFHVNTHLHTHAATCSVNECQTNILSHLSGGTLHPQHPGKTSIPGTLRQVIVVLVPTVSSRLVSPWDFPDNFVEDGMPLIFLLQRWNAFSEPKTTERLLLSDSLCVWVLQVSESRWQNHEHKSCPKDIICKVSAFKCLKTRTDNVVFQGKMYQYLCSWWRKSLLGSWATFVN